MSEQQTETGVTFRQAVDAQVHAPYKVVQPSPTAKNDRTTVPWDRDTIWNVKMVRLKDPPPRIAIRVDFGSEAAAQKFLDEMGTGLTLSDLPEE